MPLKPFLCAIAMVLCLALPAKAHEVTVGGTTYEIGVILTDFTTSATLLEAQPWWGSFTLARDIALAVFNPVNAGAPPATGLMFAYEPSIAPGFNEVVILQPGGAGTFVVQSMNAAASVHYAQVIPGVPEIDGTVLPQALFVLFALGLWLRVRRQRHAG